MIPDFAGYGMSGGKPGELAFYAAAALLLGRSRGRPTRAVLAALVGLSLTMPLGAQQPVDLIAHVHRHTDRASLIGHRADQRLANPPRRVGRETIAATVIEAVGRPEAWEWAIDMVRKGGTVNFFGGCASGTKVQACHTSPTEQG